MAALKWPGAEGLGVFWCVVVLPPPPQEGQDHSPLLWFPAATHIQKHSCLSPWRQGIDRIAQLVSVWR